MNTESISEKKEVNREPSVHLIVFKLGSEEYGIRIEQVKEVTFTPEIARMPKIPVFIKGVANIRGDIIALLDLEERFHISSSALVNGEAKSYSKSYTLVLEAKDYTIGLLVREVPQSLSIPVSRIEKTPSFIQDLQINDNYIEGIGKLGERLIIVLDIHKILTFDEAEQLKA
ncbi:chemotaxis protein CheW [Adhaeribacter radiodurans]|uniref:Purine-binding chemotaxis protein CheW n=1 Tax=Adhaeribacter radiodurans TaxID=2745197 RepID=A0A7L7L6N0_9BACT|nr:chemotaxis protein CheW [Adhaeribacter radiodurans]QMU28491.1 purine-binding chemotaxis protein CheW [Adhaeribacter radiodurans]